MKWFFLKWLPVLSFAVLIFCQMTWQYFDSPSMYYIGLAVCLLGLAYREFHFNAKGSRMRMILSFIVGLCVWNLAEELFFDPEKYDPAEYWGLVVGGIFLTYQIWKKSKN